MQSKNKYDNEQIYTWVVVAILVIAVVIVVYFIFKSNSSLYLNTDEQAQENKNSEQNMTNSTNTNNSDQNTVSQEEKNNMNVDQNVIDQNNKNNAENTQNQEQNQETATPKETQIATYTTTIYDKDENRVYNITLANQKLNNKIVKPGEVFSFNNTIGPMGEKQGFKKAIGFDTNGNKIQTFGGGLCQISSTIYNCALIANLEIVERHPHSRRVYYVPKDKDATIYYGSLDFKFKNTTDKDIKIVAKNDKYNVTIELYKEGA